MDQPHLLLFVSGDPHIAAPRPQPQRDFTVIRQTLEAPGERRFSFRVDHLYADRLERLPDQATVSDSVIVHFACHAARDLLYLDNPHYYEVGKASEYTPSARLTSAADLIEILRPACYSVRLIVLSACSSSQIAEQLARAQVCDCAVGIDREIEAASAARLSHRLYQALARGQAVAAAVEEANADLLQGAPRFVLHRGARDPSAVRFAPRGPVVAQWPDDEQLAGSCETSFGAGRVWPRGIFWIASITADDPQDQWRLFRSGLRTGTARDPAHASRFNLFSVVKPSSIVFAVRADDADQQGGALRYLRNQVNEFLRSTDSQDHQVMEPLSTVRIGVARGYCEQSPTVLLQQDAAGPGVAAAHHAREQLIGTSEHIRIVGAEPIDAAARADEAARWGITLPRSPPQGQQSLRGAPGPQGKDPTQAFVVMGELLGIQEDESPQDRLDELRSVLRGHVPRLLSWESASTSRGDGGPLLLSDRIFFEMTGSGFEMAVYDPNASTARTCELQCLEWLATLACDIDLRGMAITIAAGVGQVEVTRHPGWRVPRDGMFTTVARLRSEGARDRDPTIRLDCGLARALGAQHATPTTFDHVTRSPRDLIDHVDRARRRHEPRLPGKFFEIRLDAGEHPAAPVMRHHAITTGLRDTSQRLKQRALLETLLTATIVLVCSGGAHLPCIVPKIMEDHLLPEWIAIWQSMAFLVLISLIAILYGWLATVYYVHRVIRRLLPTLGSNHFNPHVREALCRSMLRLSYGLVRAPTWWRRWQVIKQECGWAAFLYWSREIFRGPQHRVGQVPALPELQGWGYWLSWIVSAGIVAHCFVAVLAVRYGVIVPIFGKHFNGKLQTYLVVMAVGYAWNNVTHLRIAKIPLLNLFYEFSEAESLDRQKARIAGLVDTANGVMHFVAVALLGGGIAYDPSVHNLFIGILSFMISVWSGINSMGHLTHARRVVQRWLKAFDRGRLRANGLDLTELETQGRCQLGRAVQADTVSKVPARLQQRNAEVLFEDILHSGMQLMSSRGDLLVQGLAVLHRWTLRMVADHRWDDLENAVWFVVTRRGVVLAWRGVALERLGWRPNSEFMMGSMPHRVTSFYGDGVYAARTVEWLARYAGTEMELDLELLAAGPPQSPPPGVGSAMEAVWVPVQRLRLFLKAINSETLCGGYIALGIPVRGTRRWYECLPRQNGEWLD